jgi:carbonic anhydrase
MTVLSTLPCRRAAALLLLALGFGAARGEERAAAEHAAAATEHATAASASANARAAKPLPPLEARGPRDPMDLLRERLAQKLGATKAPDANANVVRVVSKASADHETETPAVMIAPRPARRKPAPAADGAPAAGSHSSHWDYSGNAGPEAWAQMNPEFAKCSSGTRQSPIDIRDGIKVELEAVKFDYRPSSFRVIDNGHTVQVNVGSGNTIEVMGRRFELVQFHFHRPSEERIDGKQFDMVAHLVHKDPDGRLAVVAVLLERGAAQALVQSVWNNLPLEKGDELTGRGMLNLADLLPIDRSYYTYMGSLTTPPCSEGVLWMVMKKPVQISAEQVGIFARLYPMNARPVQSASGRLIKESN